MKRTNYNILLSTQVPHKFSFGTWGRGHNEIDGEDMNDVQIASIIESGCGPCGGQQQSIDITLQAQQFGKIVRPKSGHAELQLRKAIEAPSTLIDRHHAVWSHTAVDHWPWDRQHVPSKPKICTTCVGSVIFPTLGGIKTFLLLLCSLRKKSDLVYRVTAYFTWDKGHLNSDTQVLFH